MLCSGSLIKNVITGLSLVWLGLGAARAQEGSLVSGQKIWLQRATDLLPSQSMWRKNVQDWRAPAGTELTVVESRKEIVTNGKRWTAVLLRDSQGNEFVTSLKNMESTNYTADPAQAAAKQLGQASKLAEEELRSPRFPQAGCDFSPAQSPVRIKRAQTHSLALSARKLLGVYFQDCEAAKKVWTAEILAVQRKSPIERVERGSITVRSLSEKKREDYLNWHYALSGLKGRKSPPYPQHESCSHVFENTKAPLPIYGYGAKCETDFCWNPKESTMDLRADRNRRKDGDVDGVDETKNGAPLAAIDCSGFVAASFAAAGLKMTPKAWPPELVVGTGKFPEYVGQGCIEVATIEYPKGIREGDVVNVSRNHVVIIDSVGPDPLGIQKAGGNCDRISASSLDFTVTHSGSAGDLGPARFDAKLEVPAGTVAMGSKLRNGLLDMARRVCRAEVEKAQGKASGKAVSGQEGSFSVLRHRSDRKECRIDPQGKGEKAIRLKGQECLEKSSCELG
ncbi:MAG: hypothetical protein ACK5QT_03515 [Oligoflexia bacterium]